MTIRMPSLGACPPVGVVDSVHDVRSPTPSVVALIGLPGILAGEQVVPVGRSLI